MTGVGRQGSILPRASELAGASGGKGLPAKQIQAVSLGLHTPPSPADSATAQDIRPNLFYFLTLPETSFPLLSWDTGLLSTPPSSSFHLDTTSFGPSTRGIPLPAALTQDQQQIQSDLHHPASLAAVVVGKRYELSHHPTLLGPWLGLDFRSQVP